MTDAENGGVQAPGILAVDDLPANLELLLNMLKTRGYRTRAAVSGDAALKAVAAEAPELILLDINMPGMDGYEVCSRLKADPATKDIPVIFLSALNETLDKVKAFGAGGVDYISKPFQFEEVEARVKTHLQLLRQQKELRRSYDRLRELETMRDGLVHMIAHDLRSPLGAIQAFMEFLKKDMAGALSESAAEDLEEICKSSGVMMRMVSDLLDASKMENGKMQLNLTSFDVRALLERAALAMRPLASGRRLEVGEFPSAIIKGDHELLTRVVQNLVGNALKYAPRDGYVLLTAKAAGGGVSVMVENNGPDIPAEYHGKIFEKFGQVDAKGQRMPYSTGLGLSFCKLAVEAHGGRIGVRSSPGTPTVFWFELKS